MSYTTDTLNTVYVYGSEDSSQNVSQGLEFRTGSESTKRYRIQQDSNGYITLYRRKSDDSGWETVYSGNISLISTLQSRITDIAYKLTYSGNWATSSKTITNGTWVASGCTISIGYSGRYILIANGAFKTTTESVIGIKVHNNRTNTFYDENIRKSVANQSSVLNFVTYGDFVVNDIFESYFYNGSSASVSLNNLWITAIRINY